MPRKSPGTPFRSASFNPHELEALRFEKTGISFLRTRSVLGFRKSPPLDASFDDFGSEDATTMSHKSCLLGPSEFRKRRNPNRLCIVRLAKIRTIRTPQLGPLVWKPPSMQSKVQDRRPRTIAQDSVSGLHVWIIFSSSGCRAS